MIELTAHERMVSYLLNSSDFEMTISPDGVVSFDRIACGKCHSRQHTNPADCEAE